MQLQQFHLQHLYAEHYPSMLLYYNQEMTNICANKENKKCP
jgi:hypothetical protein